MRESCFADWDTWPLSYDAMKVSAPRTEGINDDKESLVLIIKACYMCNGLPGRSPYAAKPNEAISDFITKAICLSHY